MVFSADLYHYIISESNQDSIDKIEILIRNSAAIVPLKVNIIITPI